MSQNFWILVSVIQFRLKHARSSFSKQKLERNLPIYAEKAKRRKQKPTAFSERMKDLAVNILSGLISGLLTTAILKLLGW